MLPPCRGVTLRGLLRMMLANATQRALVQGLRSPVLVPASRREFIFKLDVLFAFQRTEIRGQSPVDAFTVKHSQEHSKRSVHRVCRSRELVFLLSFSLAPAASRRSPPQGIPRFTASSPTNLRLTRVTTGPAANQRRAMENGGAAA